VSPGTEPTFPPYAPSSVILGSGQVESLAAAEREWQRRQWQRAQRWRRYVDVPSLPFDLPLDHEEIERYEDRINRINRIERQRRAEWERQREWERRHAERNQRTKTAAARAEEILRLLLDDQQWASWRVYEQFTITTPAGNRYRIRRGVSENVYLLDDTGEIVETLCAHPERMGDDGQLPVEDVVIAQVLALRADEAGYRRVANIHNHRTGRWSNSGHSGSFWSHSDW
jgi:hypothetical protein